MRVNRGEGDGLDERGQRLHRHRRYATVVLGGRDHGPDERLRYRRLPARVGGRCEAGGQMGEEGTDGVGAAAVQHHPGDMG